MPGVVVTLGASSAPRVRTHRVAIARVPGPTLHMPQASVCSCVCLCVQQRKYDLHYRVALIINYLGHCVSVAALVAAFLLFLALR